MKINTNEFKHLLDEESDEFEQMFDREQVAERINKLVAKEKHSDFGVYKSQDPKRRMKR